MPDEPSITLGELGRLIQALRGDVREDMAALNARLDRMVSLDVYAAEKHVLTKGIDDLSKRVDAMANQRERDADRITQTRRWIVGAVLVPLLGIVVPLLMMVLKGAGS